MAKGKRKNKNASNKRSEWKRAWAEWEELERKERRQQRRQDQFNLFRSLMSNSIPGRTQVKNYVHDTDGMYILRSF